MNDLTDIKEIVENYYIKGGRLLENASDLSAPKKAERIWSEGLTKLESLKLSREDRRNFRLLRDCFKFAIKAAQAHQKGNHRKAEALIEQSADFGHRYNAALTARAVRNNGD